MFAILDTVSLGYVSCMIVYSTDAERWWTEGLAYALTFDTKAEAEEKIQALMLDEFQHDATVKLAVVGIENFIVGMEIYVDDVLSLDNTKYINYTTLKDNYVEYRFDLTEAEYFKLASSFLLERDFNVVSMDNASIIRTVYAY